jgi:hypothetical protein
MAALVAGLLLGGPAFGGVITKVYVCSAGSAAENTTISNLLTARGYTVTIGVTPSALTSAVDLSTYAGVLLNMTNSPAIDMQDSGETLLKNFVQAGGGLVTGEWVAWNSSNCQILKTILPVLAENTKYIPSSANQTYTQVTADAVMNKNLGTTVTFTPTSAAGYGTQLTAQNGATVFYSGSAGGSGVVGWDNVGGASGGAVVSFGSLFGATTFGSANYKTLLGNAMEWVAPTPEPATLTLLAVGGLGVLMRSRRRRA